MERITYAESTPAIDETIIGKSKRSTVSSDNLSENSSLLNTRQINHRRSGFLRVDFNLFVVIVRARLLRLVHIHQTTFPVCVATQSALIIHTPSQNLVVMRKRDTVHSTSRNLHDTGIREDAVELWSRTFSLLEGITHSQFSIAVRPKSEHVETRSRRSVDDDFRLGRFGCCCRLGGFGSRNSGLLDDALLLDSFGLDMSLLALALWFFFEVGFGLALCACVGFCFLKGLLGLSGFLGGCDALRGGGSRGSLFLSSC